MISPLEMTLFLLLASVAGVVVFRFLNLPPMLGYLTVGIVVGPHAFGIVRIRKARRTWPSSAWCS
jgi:CPA2 family monovalent cation:H+ antiporter-2